MNVDRRNKYSQRSKREVEIDKVDFKFSLEVLNYFCSYVLSSNRNIKRTDMSTLRVLMRKTDTEPYGTEPDKINRIKFINIGLEARLDKNLSDPQMIYLHIQTTLGLPCVDSIGSLSELDNYQVDWLNEYIASRLKVAHVLKYKKSLQDIINQIDTSDITELDGVIAAFESIINNAQNEIRSVKMKSSGDMRFSLREQQMKDVVYQVHSELMCPANKLLCGIYGLNEMTAGGFEAGRVYMFFGLPGEGKSITLLDLAYQIKLYNKGYRPKDPTKTPCVVLLTMENTIRETVERLFAMAVSDDLMTAYTQEEVYEMLRTKGSLHISDFNPIDIEIVYVPGESVDTSYLYTLVDELAYDGKEVICLLQDYVKRIKSVNTSYGDIRIELGNIVNEFKTFAALMDIPVITASQLNRDAAGKVDSKQGKITNSDIVRLFGRQNIGESLLMLENVDCAFAIAVEWDDENHKYLGINRLKNRFRAPTQLSCIHQPYEVGNTIKLVEDAYAQVPAYKLTMEQEAVPRLSGRSSYPTANEIVEYDKVALSQTPDNSGNMFSAMNASNAISSLEKRAIRPIRIAS